MKRITLLAAFLAAPVAASASQPAQSPERQIDALFAPWNRPGMPGAVVGVIRDGKVVLTKRYGMADIERGVPMSPSAEFLIGSMSKQFTAFAVHLLAKDGKLSLDDDVHLYLPDVPDFGRKITIRHLMHHTSGLRDYFDLMAMAGLRPAFADNPAWASCYCMHMLHAGTAEAWDRATAAENRERVAACIDRGANDGLLALDGGEVVGWLQAARAEKLGGLGKWFGLEVPADTGVLSCFVIHPERRGQGLARRLMDAALARFAAVGVRTVEGYPAAQAECAADAFRGPLSLYTSAGFVEVGRFGKRIRMRRAL